MHIISRKKLREFWGLHPRARRPLESWHRVARHAEWGSFVDVKAVFRHADQVGRYIVFDIGGNKYRLIAVIHYNRRKLFVRHVLTHEEYSTGDWKNE